MFGGGSSFGYPRVCCSRHSRLAGLKLVILLVIFCYLFLISSLMFYNIMSPTNQNCNFHYLNFLLRKRNSKWLKF